jgi:hypothetical protein
MKFTPKTEDEVQAEQLCPAGKYPFTVLESAEVESKSAKNLGKPMVKLKLNIHADDGDYHVFDYIGDWFMAHKFRHFFFAVGMGHKYEAGTVDASNNALQGLEGWCDIIIQKAKGEYGPKNSVNDYCESEHSGSHAPAPAPVAAKRKSESEVPSVGAMFDDIPFDVPTP